MTLWLTSPTLTVKWTSNFEIEIIDDEDDGAVAFYDYLRTFGGSVLKTKDDSFAWDDPAM